MSYVFSVRVWGLFNQYSTKEINSTTYHKTVFCAFLIMFPSHIFLEMGEALVFLQFNDACVMTFVHLRVVEYQSKLHDYNIKINSIRQQWPSKS